MGSTKRITIMAMLVAIGTISSHLIWLPAGVAKAFPIQHSINVIAGILLGPGPAVIVAFAIGLLRNLLGVGSLLAFPGGMIGAFFAGYLYSRYQKTWTAALGEIFGTGVIGALLSVPVARLLLQTSAAALAFVPPFLVSSITGAAIGLAVVAALRKTASARL
ncbi:energy coupling factor transporter S component ThiW [Brevibacillus sp. B_LB10_24]|uniref:energy coupling factor transporter S component ThiW n=1 Tax=Brevibacillus sp. B_LB10_24 TaxID=3380645 RepID=UPI0038B9B8E0